MKLTSTLNRVFGGAFGAPTIIKLKSGTVNELFPTLRQLGVSSQSMPLFNMVSTFLTTKTIDAIADLDIVEKIYVDWAVKIPELPIGFSFSDFILQQGVLGFGFIRSIQRPSERQEDWIPTTESRNYLGLAQAKVDGVTGSGVKVAIVDSEGSVRAANHRQFFGKRVERYQVRPIFQTDSNGHGVHVATTIGGQLVQAMPNFYVEGMAPDATIMLVKCLLTPLGSGSTSDCIKGINMAFDQGADIVNLSLGSECQDPAEDPFVQAINSLPKEKIVCAASGNESATKIGSPAIAENAIAVGALNNRTGQKAGFSNSGSELAFCMPGMNIFSGVTRETLCDVTGGGPEGFSALSGTSMATPHMTGMVALAIQLMSKYKFRPTVETIKEIGRRYGEPHSNEYGYGAFTYDMLKRYVQENLT